MLPRMLHEVPVATQSKILSRSREKLAAREVPTPTESELADSLRLFSDRLVEILRAEKGDHGSEHHDISANAATHGGEFLRIGPIIGQVVRFMSTCPPRGRDGRRMLKVS